MAIAFVLEGSGFTQSDYEEGERALGREDVQAPNPEGLIAHLAGPTDDGWRIVDVWESQEQAEAFYGSDSFRSMVSSLRQPLEPRPWRLHRIEVDKTLRQVG